MVVSLDSPDKWKVNHGAIQDYIEMKATEEDKNVLMNSCIVNVKQEPSAKPATKFVNENINISGIVDKYKDNSDDVVDISSDSDTKADHVPAAVIKNSVDPLLDVPEAGLSDYESDHVEEVEDTIEHEIAAKLEGLKINKNVSIVDISDEDTDDDVVVETTIGKV